MDNQNSLHRGMSPSCKFDGTFGTCIVNKHLDLKQKDKTPKYVSVLTSNLINELEAPDMRPMLNAVMAAYALLYFVNRQEGSLGRAGNTRLAETFKELKELFTKQGEAIFRDFMNKFNVNPGHGRLDAITAVGALRGNARISRLLIQSCIAIATSDGRLPKEEVKAINSITTAIGDPRWVHLTWMSAEDLGLSHSVS